jgi:hypothetical protein
MVSAVGVMLAIYGKNCFKDICGITNAPLPPPLRGHGTCFPSETY